MNAPRIPRALALLVVLAALFALAASRSARAGSLANLAVTNLSAPDVSTTTINFVDLEGRSTAGITSSNLSGPTPSFAARLAGMASADSFPPNGGTAEINHHVRMQVTFDIVAAAAEAWTINVDQDRNFALTIFDDGGTTNAEAWISGPLTATYQVQGLQNSSGNLTFPGSGTENTGLQVQAFDLPVFATSSDLLQGIGPATVTLTVGQSLSARSWGNAFGSAGLQSAVRFGLDGTQLGVSADDYPGVGDRIMTRDGHFLHVHLQFAPIPEPGTLALLLIAAALLAPRRLRIPAA